MGVYYSRQIVSNDGAIATLLAKWIKYMELPRPISRLSMYHFRQATGAFHLFCHRPDLLLLFQPT